LLKTLQLLWTKKEMKKVRLSLPSTLQFITACRACPNAERLGQTCNSSRLLSVPAQKGRPSAFAGRSEKKR